MRERTATAVTCFLWDGLLTFDQEVEYIWMRNKRNPTRILYLWFRYATVAGLLYSAYGEHMPGHCHKAGAESVSTVWQCPVDCIPT